MSSCCSTKPQKTIDYLLWGSIILISFSFIARWINLPYLQTFTAKNVMLINEMWLSMGISIIIIGLMDHVPDSMFAKLLGKPHTTSGIIKASLAGVLLDLCSHGILLVAMKLYKKGMSLGQVLAFLIASPWNSFSLTLIMWSLIGLPWTIGFIALSILVAILSGICVTWCVKHNILPKNPHKTEQQSSNQNTTSHLKQIFQIRNISIKNIWKLIQTGWKESQMILRWIFFGIVLTSLLVTIIPPDMFSKTFGPSILGLTLTLLFATVLEVCSEGSTPIAAEIFKTAKAPGNAFAFLMAGVATDYTEIMAIKETTLSWKIALFLPLITLPQIVLIGWVLNYL